MNQQDSVTGSVLVVGGGIAGIQAALDLSEMGFYVYLVEKSASIGGKMARLDKTFPTNDCSLCILAPKLVEAGRSPNIKILTNATLESLEGQVGNFTARVHREPRFINEDLCTACGDCTMYCPVFVSDGYNEGLAITRAPHKDYPQAVPTSFYIDAKMCLFLNHETCQICVPTCQAKAIDFSQKEERLDLSVGAVILSPGFGRIHDDVLARYGYGRFPDVVTSLEFERIMCASGPSMGEVIRPSDGKHPKRIAFLQCVGSRDINTGNGYCSSVCCMYAVKGATIVKEHAPDTDITIFYMDMRTQGKGFDASRQRAREQYGIKFVRSRVGDVFQEGEQLRLCYADREGNRKEEDFDMVVLSVGLESPEDAQSLARTAGIKLNQYDFCRTQTALPLNTTRPGVYVAGAFQGPKDIPESVMQAIGSAALAGEALHEARGRNVVKKEYPEEMEVGQDPRIGVLVCHCGINIGGVVNVPEVVKYASTLDNVVFADGSLYACSQDTQNIIKDTIREHNLNRVIVAACTPRTHEPGFQETLKDAGLNGCLFEMANIRDHCSWVHAHEPAEATAKAKDLVRMAVAKARLLAPLPEQSVPVTPRALVIGGGVAGMTAALSIADQGFQCFLVEKSGELGGNLRHIRTILTGQNPASMLAEMEGRVRNHPRIKVYTHTVVGNVSGYIGNFKTDLQTENGLEQVEHGVVILATGGREHHVEKYGYGQSSQVVTQLELEEILSDVQRARGINEVVMIQCAGSRGDDLSYCSKICCGGAVKNALRLKDLNPNARIYVLYRDVRTYGFMEDYYRQAREKGVIFVNYEKENPPVVSADGERVAVEFTDLLLNEKISLQPDLVVLSVGVVPNDVEALAKTLKVPLTQDNFFLEAHVKLRPVEMAVSGVYVCGLAHSPKPIDEAISQAKAAAGKACIPLAKGFVTVEPIVSEVNKERCIGCGICESLCPYKAIRLVKADGKKKAETIAASCKGCGICASHCPTMAISMGGFTTEEIMAQIRAFGEC
ncbi:MAG: CoB--CoM heterodisulfide reductase iron-sulfur subunit A family protein [Deltaproteobacteria bacterium]|nr:MAG: CoB--CoM heterodisulfide reductase iron-sulfur subunit A family protein [Deltaproteobacteria bacterium]